MYPRQLAAGTMTVSRVVARKASHSLWAVDKPPMRSSSRQLVACRDIYIHIYIHTSIVQHKKQNNEFQETWQLALRTNSCAVTKLDSGP